MRSDEEIVARIAQIVRDGLDWLGTEQLELISRLPYGRAKPFLREEASAENWRPRPRDRESVLNEMLEYMPFAWDKAKNCRGISASRSMSHYAVWVWLLGDDLGDFHGYEFYGKDNLVKICRQYGWDPSQWDDGIRVNDETELAP